MPDASGTLPRTAHFVNAIKQPLKVFTTILDKTYQTGRKVALDFKSNMKIVFDEFLPQWNYTAKPELQVI